MRTRTRLAMLVLLALPCSALAQQPSAPAAPSVKVGERAPEFTLPYLAPEAGGKFAEKKVSLGDFKGKNTVILAFFPAAFSPG